MREVAIERMAKALYESAVQAALQEVSSVSIDLNIVRDTYLDMQDETDRSCAITIFALIDELICDLFLLHVNPSYTQSRRRLFAEYGILPTASRRIEMLFALNWISQDTFHDLNILRKIRNSFAHTASIRDFRTNPVRGYLTSFEISLSDYLEPVLRNMEIEDGRARLDKITNAMDDKSKWYFLMQSCFVLRKAAMEVLVFPVSIKHRIDPRSILGVFPEEEGILRHFHMTFASIMHVIFDLINRPREDTRTS